jgi:hypothetical protein
METIVVAPFALIARPDRWLLPLADELVPRVRWRWLLAYAAPIAGVLLLNSLYNYVRFGVITNWAYQMLIDKPEVRGMFPHGLMSWQYWPTRTLFRAKPIFQHQFRGWSRRSAVRHLCDDAGVLLRAARAARPAYRGVLARDRFLHVAAAVVRRHRHDAARLSLRDGLLPPAHGAHDAWDGPAPALVAHHVDRCLHPAERVVGVGPQHPAIEKLY